jgi:hypothetical protein
MKVSRIATLFAFALVPVTTALPAGASQYDAALTKRSRKHATFFVLGQRNLLSKAPSLFSILLPPPPLLPSLSSTLKPLELFSSQDTYTSYTFLFTLLSPTSSIDAGFHFFYPHDFHFCNLIVAFYFKTLKPV